MAENSAIEWTTHTFNPWVGCTKVSPGCDNCYAESWARRTGQPTLWTGERRRTSAANWQQPIKWNKRAGERGVRERVFCASLADVFDNQVPERWRWDLWHYIQQTPHLDWLLLTKRPQNISKMLPTEEIGAPAWGNGWPNVWLGTTAENQAEADRRIPHLLAAPAAVRFLSCEPLLGALDLTHIPLVPRVPGSLRAGIHINALAGRYVESGLDYIGPWDINGPCPTDWPARRLNWVIAGGESGPGARPMHPDWARSLRDQCRGAGVPFFFKQWGEWLPTYYDDGGWYPDDGSAGDDGFRLAGCRLPIDLRTKIDGQDLGRVGKKRAGRLLDGAEHNGMPRHG